MIFNKFKKYIYKNQLRVNSHVTNKFCKASNAQIPQNSQIQYLPNQI